MISQISQNHQNLEEESHLASKVLQVGKSLGLVPLFDENETFQIILERLKKRC